MVIYGGSDGLDKLFKNMYSLNLKNYEWSKLQVMGNHPGPRESMGYTSLNDAMYIFGGNVNISKRKDRDIFSNDLYRMTLSGKRINCERISPNSTSPPERQLHSMCTNNKDSLIVSCGEGFAGALSDVWVFNVLENYWTEIIPAGQ